MLNQVKEAVRVEVTVEVDNEWIEYCTQSSDLFRTDHCGYWMYGMEHEAKLGWLCYEHNDGEKTVDQVADSAEYEDIVALWKAGADLPEGWYRLDKEAAVRAYGEGFKRSGAFWYSDGDASDYDVAIQKALLGKVVYG